MRRFQRLQTWHFVCRLSTFLIGFDQNSSDHVSGPTRMAVFGAEGFSSKNSMISSVNFLQILRHLDDFLHRGTSKGIKVGFFGSIFDELTWFGNFDSNFWRSKVAVIGAELVLSEFSAIWLQVFFFGVWPLPQCWAPCSKKLASFSTNPGFLEYQKLEQIFLPVMEKFFSENLIL